MSAPDALIDYWPILRQPAAELMGQIGAGDHDAYLEQLRRMELGHSARDVVLESCDLRLRKLGSEPEKPAPKGRR